MSVQIGIAQLQLDNDSIASITNAALNDQSRFMAKEAETDLWGKHEAPLPDGAVPVLVHEVYCQIEWFDQIIWFNRNKSRDELWVFTDLDTNVRTRLEAERPLRRADALLSFGQEAACALSVPSYGSFDESLLGLLSTFFSTQAGAVAGLERIIATAYINKAHLRVILRCIDRYREKKRLESEEYSRQARDNETEIIYVARELGLDPEPAGIGLVQWYARCPVKRLHRLMITTSKDEFGCGYCRVKGGVKELRAFVAKEKAHEHFA